MKLRHLLVIMSLGICGIWPAFSREAAGLQAKGAAQKEKKGAAQKADDKKEEAKKPSPRLPNNFGKLNLSTAQKDNIYAIQAKHNGQIDALEGQIKSLKEKRDAEILAVLTADQQEKLNSLLGDNKKKADKQDEPDK